MCMYVFAAVEERGADNFSLVAKTVRFTNGMTKEGTPIAYTSCEIVGGLSFSRSGKVTNRSLDWSAWDTRNVY